LQLRPIGLAIPGLRNNAGISKYPQLNDASGGINHDNKLVRLPKCSGTPRLP
jgi:hypothetical protein